MKKLVYFVDCFRFYRRIGNTVAHSLAAAAHVAFWKAQSTATVQLSGHRQVYF